MYLIVSEDLLIWKSFFRSSSDKIVMGITLSIVGIIPDNQINVKYRDANLGICVFIRHSNSANLRTMIQKRISDVAVVAELADALDSKASDA